MHEEYHNSISFSSTSAKICDFSGGHGHYGFSSIFHSGNIEEVRVHAFCHMKALKVVRYFIQLEEIWTRAFVVVCTEAKLN